MWHASMVATWRLYTPCSHVAHQNACHNNNNIRLVTIAENACHAHQNACHARQSECMQCASECMPCASEIHNACHAHHSFGTRAPSGFSDSSMMMPLTHAVPCRAMRTCRARAHHHQPYLHERGVQLLCLLLRQGGKTRHPAFKEDDVQGPLHSWPRAGVSTVSTPSIRRLVVPACTMMQSVYLRAPVCSQCG